MDKNNSKVSLLWAKEALQEEAKALNHSAEKLNETFCLAIECLSNMRGKLVVTGLGKSGHVGRKIAATLTSTGTPSIFLHPSEALHGDLGVFGQKDVLLAITYSGETYETVKVAKFAKKMSLPILSITGNLQSSLSLLSDFALDGSVEREICPNELAPTSSTTLAMALGDALAVSLMKARAFGPSDFARYHPEGLLGRKLSRVLEFIRTDLKPVSPNAPLEEILSCMSSPNYGVCLVSDPFNKILGIITDGDIRRFFLSKKENIREVKASQLMNAKAIFILENDSALHAAELMEKKNISCLIVLDENSFFKGLVRLKDLLKAKIF